MEQLYLIEILVDKITFSPLVTEVPDKKNIVISVTFGDLASVEIRSESLRRSYTETTDPFKRELNIDSGKSYLFPCKAENLLKSLNELPLMVSLTTESDDETSLGCATIPWAWDFTDMVDRSRFNPDNLVPASVKDVYKIISSETEEEIGEIGLFLRLSCFGQSIQTQFQIVQREGISGEVPPKKFLFKSSNAETTFQAQKYGDEGEASEALPVAPIYNPADPKWHPRAALSPANMTAEKINEVLCKNRDCPGVQKFKEYGLGPAATGKGLGTLYGPTDIPISYGLSHTYGNLENYGPYGVYTRPKTLEEPFIPKDPITCSNTSGCENCENCKPDSEDDVSSRSSSQYSTCKCSLPLSSSPSEDGGNNTTEHRVCGCCEPLRLTGGSPGEDENKIPEPMMMCKDLMQSFDKVLNEYKKALGPCGQVICPFAPNIMAETCKKFCKKEETGENELTMTPVELQVASTPIDDGLMSACGTPGCPYSRQPQSNTDKSFQQKQMKSACGSPTCPYTKNKLGSATDEDMLEIQLMDGPSVARSCGSPKCPFPISPSLPPLEPIHWDCPDPLPKGPCRNPQCPLKPPELRYNIVPKGPCGSAQCPYATPPYCGEPDCPFGPPQPCPYAEPPPCPPPSCVPGCGPPPPCGPPPCPLQPCTMPPSPPCPLPPCTMPPCPPSPCLPAPCPRPPCRMSPCEPSPCSCVCGNPGCPASPPTCGDPTCTLNPLPLPCPGVRPPPCPPPCSPSPCGGPICPYARPPCPPSPCGGSTCPYARPPCPPSPCRGPPCPPSPCGGPPCPPSPCGGPPCPPPPPCGNPNCPFAFPSSPCGNADCPYASPPPPPTSPCGAPTCPYANPPVGPCGSPDCKYAGPPDEEEDDDVCDNPDCPFRKKEPSASENEVCDNPECPFVTNKPSPCFIPPKDSVCSNPCCPYAPPPCGRPPCMPPPCGAPPCGASPCSPPPCYRPPPCGPPPTCGSPTCPYVYPCKLEIGGTKVTVEYGVDEKDDERRDTLKQETGAGDGETEYTSGDRPQDVLTPCSPRTCKVRGGSLECIECAADGGSDGHRRIPCPCGGTISLEGSPRTSEEVMVAEKDISADKPASQSAPTIGQKPAKHLKRNSASEKAISPSKGGKNGKKQKSKYVYKLGDLYPGVNIGHRECIIPGRNVPAKMGWLWNVHIPCLSLKPRFGWRPGAVGRTIAKRILAHRKAKGLKLLEPLTPKASKKKIKSKYSEYESDSDATVAPKPTLQVKKREGCYYITMNPLKDPKTLEDNENPYMDCTPLQFKITKNKENEDKNKTCFCGEDENEETSSDSELDIEFTPPAGIIRPERLKRKKNVVHTDTQYNPEDFATKDKEKKGKDKKGKGKGGKKGKKK